MFRYYIEEEKQQSYMDRVEKESKKLDKKNREFIELAFCNEKDSEKDPAAELGKRLENKEVWTLSDLFPESIYPALDVMIGRELRKVFISACEKRIKFPYTSGYYRRMIRSTNYKNHLEGIWALLERFIEQNLLGLDIIKLLKKDFEYNRYYVQLQSEQIATEIDRNNEEVIQIVKDMLLSENNTNILSYEVIKGIFRSDNKELVELTGKLLLAAKLQEGLRQVICENMDCGTQENFEYMFDIVCSNDLIRFSSVKRAVATFTGIGEEYGDRVTKKQVELIRGVLKDNRLADTYLKSDDNVEALIGLWYKGSVDVKELAAAMESIIATGKRHSVLLVSYYLGIVDDERYLNKVAKGVIRKFAKDFEKNDALEILACYMGFVSGSLHWYSIKRDLEDGRVRLTKYFKDEEEAREFFDIFEYAIKSMKEKEKVFSPCIFPWHSVKISKEEISSILLMMAVFVKGNLVDRAIEYIKQANTYYRADITERLLSKPETGKQRAMVLEMLADRTGASSAAKEIILSNSMADEYIDKIHDVLRLKTPEIRKNAIEIIYSRSNEKLSDSISYLISQKDVNKRLAGLDIMLKAKADGRMAMNRLIELADSLTSVSSSEQVLIEQLKGGKMQDELAKELYDVNYEKEFEVTLSENREKQTDDGNRITVVSSMSIADLFSTGADKLLQIVKKLNALYTEHENYEYKSCYNSDCILANSLMPMTNDRSRAELNDYPLADVWRKFYEEEIREFKVLYELYMLSNTTERYSYSGRESRMNLKEILGFDPGVLEKKIKEEKLKYFGDMYNNRQCHSLISLLYSEYKNEHRAFVYEASKAVIVHIYKNFDVTRLTEKSRYSWRSDDSYDTVFEVFPFMALIDADFGMFEGDDEFKEYFAVTYNMYKKFYEFYKKENARPEKIFLGLIDYAKAVKLGIVEKDEFYIEVLDRGDTASWIRTISGYLDGSLPDKRIDGYNDAVNNETVEFIKEEGRKIIEYISGIELNRGDSPTKYSNAIRNIRRVEGIDNLIKILKALGNMKLDRNSWYYSGGDSKSATLSHLLKVCHPGKEDNAQKLKEALKGTDITAPRLIEVAMYSSQWIDILEEYLGWKGLASGCYYFQAHMSDVDKKKEGLFAKYTPISIEDLSLGAFDVDWFNSAYKELGSENFAQLYESAKYISDGAKHSRARKFADAVLGKLERADTEEQIADKRNKDLVASYALIPLEKDKEKDILRRYKFLQKFLKESLQFGAQRRASEAKAVEIALSNLARNAGFSDVTRLIWTAETDIIKELKEYFEPKKLEDITVYIRIDESGKASIVYEKDGKELKSLPAKLKKDSYIEELKEVQKNLKEQYSRSKKMLEESMEDGGEFYVYEIENIVKNNNVIMPLIKDLVFKSGDKLGFYNEKGLVSPDGGRTVLKDDDIIKIAHALDLYKSKDWSKYQKYLFDRAIKQPFKQVFRELYVKTEDELGIDTTLRYSGNQIQPAKTIAVLKSRRWVIDGEEGLQKVYYKQNIIAKIYALADWFSPADIEAPTLEWVEFYDRKTFKKLLIDNIPELIFTEVMRDVDLAVSVAHVGGVDPEASHSTIEMRKAIVEFNLPLFGISNVSFTDKHAIIKGSLAEYSVHLGSGLVHQKAGSVINVLPVHSQQRGKLFLPFVDEDPKTAEIMSKILLFAEDKKIKDPSILNQINVNR